MSTERRATSKDLYGTGNVHWRGRAQRFFPADVPAAKLALGFFLRADELRIIRARIAEVNEGKTFGGTPVLNDKRMESLMLFRFGLVSAADAHDKIVALNSLPEFREALAKDSETRNQFVESAKNLRTHEKKWRRFRSTLVAHTEDETIQTILEQQGDSISGGIWVGKTQTSYSFDIATAAVMAGFHAGADDLDDSDSIHAEAVETVTEISDAGIAVRELVWPVSFAYGQLVPGFWPRKS